MRLDVADGKHPDPVGAIEQTRFPARREIDPHTPLNLRQGAAAPGRSLARAAIHRDFRAARRKD
jgi:hypothetical protein